MFLFLSASVPTLALDPEFYLDDGFFAALEARLTSKVDKQTDQFFELADRLGALDEMLQESEEDVRFRRVHHEKRGMVESQSRKLQSSSNHTLEEVKSELYTALSAWWIILCGALVMFMSSGFALVESGMCRAKSCQAILVKNFADLCCGTIVYFVCGYAFMYGGVDENSIQLLGGNSGFFGEGVIR